MWLLRANTAAETAAVGAAAVGAAAVGAAAAALATSSQCRGLLSIARYPLLLLPPQTALLLALA